MKADILWVQQRSEVHGLHLHVRTLTVTLTLVCLRGKRHQLFLTEAQGQGD